MDGRDTAAPEEGAAVFVLDEAVRIVVNGEPMDVADGLSVDDLLARLGVTPQFTAVAVNREVTPKSVYASTTLKDGDRVEIVRPMGGGAS